MEELKKLCEETCKGVDFTNEKLIDDKIIESLSLITLIGALEEKYDISIDMEYIQPKYFNSLNGINELKKPVSPASDGYGELWEKIRNIMYK